MNHLQRRSEELKLANDRHRKLNHELAKTNAGYKTCIQKIQDEICLLHRENMNLIQEISKHQKKPPKLEQHSMWIADIPPLSQNARHQPPQPPTGSVQEQPQQRESDSSTAAPTKQLNSIRPESTTSPTLSGSETSININEPTAKERRVKNRKCYTLPSLKNKLRKGDPFTFRD